MLKSIVKYWKRLLAILIVLCLIAALVFWQWLLEYLNSTTDKVYQNYIVEFVAGIIFLFVPVLFGIYVGKRIKELEFYSSVEEVLNTLIKLRRRGLMKPHTVRHVVKSIVNNFGNNAVKEQWIENAAKKISQEKKNYTGECRVCTLKAVVEDNRCTYCKLNCYAWDFSLLSKEEKENQEIDKIAELERTGVNVGQ